MNRSHGINEKRYGNSGFPYHQINWCTYLLYRFLSVFSSSGKEKLNSTPLLITGLFRSGTTITARLFEEMGYSSGPKEHLLEAKGDRKILNPDGFLENYFFMDLSNYLFYKSKSWGDIPPDIETVEKMEMETDDRHKMAKFSIITLHDDRISNFNKTKALAEHNVCEAQNYLNKYFSGKSYIKNPHFGLLYSYFKKIVPNSPIVFVFREPLSAINSAKAVSPYADLNVYHAYYVQAYNEHKNGNKNIVFLNYDALVENPKISIDLIQNYFKTNANKEALINLVNAPKNKIEKNELPEKVSTVYNYMIQNSINKC
jgi:hypothetical protein